MPSGVNPPRGAVSSGTVTMLAASTYNATNSMVTYSGVDYYLCIQKGSTDDRCEWFYATGAEAAVKKNPFCTLSSTTHGIISAGTYNQTTQLFTHSGHTYELRFVYENGSLKALAVKIT
ncbi:MAG: hypothetical protein IPK60_03710 [Sandaracinaceae bacterium]|jgi:hypothetical protein|nr:hypothetical protein [Sandaracinaceae bacterium]